MARYRKGDTVMSVTNVPNRKNKCLLLGTDLYLQKVASFDDDEAADMFEKVMNYFFSAKEKHER